MNFTTSISTISTVQPTIRGRGRPQKQTQSSVDMTKTIETMAIVAQIKRCVEYNSMEKYATFNSKFKEAYLSGSIEDLVTLILAYNFFKHRPDKLDTIYTRMEVNMNHKPDLAKIQWDYVYFEFNSASDF